MSLFNNELVIVGGQDPSDSTLSNAVTAYNADTCTFRVITLTGPALEPRFMHAAAVIDNMLILWCARVQRLVFPLC